MKCAFALLSIILSTSSSGLGATNSFNLLRQAAYGGSAFDFPEDILPLANGGWLVGSTSASQPGPSKSAPARGDEDFWLMKLNADLSKVWDVSFGGTAQDRLFALAATDDGGAILAGRSASTSSGTKTTGSFGGNDFWVVKVDTNGSKVWEADYGGTGTEGAIVVRRINTNSYLVGGYSDSLANTSSGSKTAPRYGGYDFYLVCVNAQGAYQWEASYGGIGDDMLRDIVPLADGTILLCGYSSSPVSGNKTSPAYGLDDIWIVAINARGTKLWDRTFGGTGYDNIDTGGVIAEPNGGFTVCGSSDSFNSKGIVEGYFLKCNGGGALGSSKRLTSSLDVVPTCIAPAAGGHYVVFSTIFRSQDSGTGYPTDLLLWELDADGNILSERVLEGSSAVWPPNNWSKNIYPMGNNQYLLAATSYSDPDSVKKAPNLGGGDVWLLSMELSPPFPWVGIAPAVKLSFHMELGYTYQLQSSPNLLIWTNSGVPFVAQSNLVSQYADADAGTKFWRLVKKP